MSYQTIDREAVYQRLRETPSSAFRGETPFRELTPAQRLDALASLATFVQACKGLAAPGHTRPRNDQRSSNHD